MRILLTADLHFKENWYRWLIGHQADFGLICIAGDLLDMFFPVPLLVFLSLEAPRFVMIIRSKTRIVYYPALEKRSKIIYGSRRFFRIRAALLVRPKI